MTISKHITELQENLANICLQKKVQFGIWCLWPILHDAEVIAFLNSKINPDLEASIHTVFSDMWDIQQNTHNSDWLSFVHQIEVLDWQHEELDDTDESASQGLMDLLAGVSSLIHGYLDQRDDYLTNCAEMAINRLSYLIDFEKETEGALDKELKQQVDTIHALLRKAGCSLSLCNRELWS